MEYGAFQTVFMFVYVARVIFRYAGIGGRAA